MCKNHIINDNLHKVHTRPVRHRFAQVYVSCTNLHRFAQIYVSCTDSYRFTQVYTDLHRSAQVCTGLLAQICRLTQVCTGMHRLAQICTDLHRFTQVYTGLHSPTYFAHLIYNFCFCNIFSHNNDIRWTRI